jgi:hypothetical protein
LRDAGIECIERRAGFGKPRPQLGFRRLVALVRWPACRLYDLGVQTAPALRDILTFADRPGERVGSRRKTRGFSAERLCCW